MYEEDIAVAVELVGRALSVFLRRKDVRNPRRPKELRFHNQQSVLKAVEVSRVD
jgi:hypothetical protein